MYRIHSERDRVFVLLNKEPLFFFDLLLLIGWNMELLNLNNLVYGAVFVVLSL
jgi:hypothetical protein